MELSNASGKHALLILLVAVAISCITIANLSKTSTRSQNDMSSTLEALDSAQKIRIQMSPTIQTQWDIIADGKKVGTIHKKVLAPTDESTFYTNNGYIVGVKKQVPLQAFRKDSIFNSELQPIATVNQERWGRIYPKYTMTTNDQLSSVLTQQVSMFFKGTITDQHGNIAWTVTQDAPQLRYTLDMTRQSDTVTSIDAIWLALIQYSASSD